VQSGFVNFGIRTSIFVFLAVAVANLAVIIVNVVALKTTASLLGIPSVPLTLVVVIVSYLLVVHGNYKTIQGIMLFSSLLYVAYIFSAIQSKPDWGSAISNLIYPHGVKFTASYLKDYIVIGLGVIGTTITPWGQFFISSFSLDKKMDPTKLKFSLIETYWGAFLTDFFSFFMIVATAATLFVHGIALVDGNQASMAIEPFAGKIAAMLFGFGIMNAGFMGIITVGLATTYAFSEFFGFSRSLDTTYNQSKQFYFVFGLQLLIATVISFIPGLDLFTIVVGAQIISAMTLPILFVFLIKFTNSKKFLGEHVNNNFQKWFAIVGTVIITCAAIFTVVSTLFGL
jgi:Mn2+/Fe2+ NRAMP family transporter